VQVLRIFGRSASGDEKSAFRESRSSCDASEALRNADYGRTWLVKPLTPEEKSDRGGLFGSCRDGAQQCLPAAAGLRALRGKRLESVCT